METQAVVTMVMKKGHGLRPLSLFDFSTQDLPLCPLDASASVAQKLRSVLLDLPEYRLSYTLTNFLFSHRPIPFSSFYHQTRLHSIFIFFSSILASNYIFISRTATHYFRE